MSYVELLAWCMDNTIDLCKRQPFDGYSIIFYGLTIVFYGLICFLWVFYGLSMVFLFTISIWFSTIFYGSFIFFHSFYGFSLVYYGFSMVTLWCFYGLLRVFYDFCYGFYDLIFYSILFYVTNLVWQIHKSRVFSLRHKCQSLWLCELVFFFFLVNIWIHLMCSISS